MANKELEIKKVERTPEQAKLVHRLSRVEGQVRGVSKMIDNGAECVDVVIQVSAAVAALNSFSRELINNELKTTIAEGAKNGDFSKLEELTKAMERLMR